MAVFLSEKRSRQSLRLEPQLWEKIALRFERIRGQYSATMEPKREFCKHVLNYMQDKGFIANWDSAGEKNRHDYVVTTTS